MTKRTILAAFFVAAVVGWSHSAQLINSAPPKVVEASNNPLQTGERRERPVGDRGPLEGTGTDRNAQPTEDGMPQAEANNLRRHRPTFHRRWYLGVDAYNTPTGVYVTSVAPRSPAQRVGLEPGDTIVTINGYQVGVVNAMVYYLGEELQRQADGRGRVRILVHNWRNGHLLNVDVSLARMMNDD